MTVLYRTISHTYKINKIGMILKMYKSFTVLCIYLSIRVLLTTSAYISKRIKERHSLDKAYSENILIHRRIQNIIKE